MKLEGLSRQAIRLAIRQSKRRGRPLTREEILQLQVQTVGLRTRVLIILFGLGAAALTLVCYRNASPFLATVGFGFGAVFLIVSGVFGRRAFLENELKKITFVGVADSIVTAIIDALI